MSATVLPFPTQPSSPASDPYWDGHVAEYGSCNWCAKPHTARCTIPGAACCPDCSHWCVCARCAGAPPEYEPPDDGPDYEAIAATYLPDDEPLF